MPSRILVVDDEHAIADLIELYLVNEGYEVCKFCSAREALRCIETEELDLAILDIMLPETNGFEICRRIRERHNYPIIMLTAKDEETDKITGLTMGADDYITKPFRPLEMVARVKAQLRRYQRYNVNGDPMDADGVFTCGGLILDINKHQCSFDEKPLILTPTEFAILKILLEKRGKVVSGEDIFKALWPEDYYSKNNNTITVHIRHLREKMMDTVDNPKYIKTVWGVGYKIEQ